MFKEQ